MPTIFAADLDSLTSATVDSWKDRLITVKDRRNLTEARLQKLRDLITQAREAPVGYTLDVGELHDRLRDVSPIPSLRSSSSNDGEAFASNFMKDDLIAAEDAYNTLLRMGGRPMRPVQYHGGLEDHGYKLGFLWHHSNQGARLRGELEKWRAFRDYQRHVRRDPTSFRQLQEYISAYWQRRGIRQELKPKLLPDLQMQTKLDEWKEFYFHQHQRLAHKENEVKQTEWQAQTSLEMLKATESYCQDGLDAGDGWYIAATVDLETYASWLAWIEDQIPLITSECAVADNAEKISRATSYHRRNPSKTVSTKNRPSAQPTLGPRHSARISKISQSRELGQKASVFKQPLRRSVRIAQRQLWGKDGSSY